MKIALYYPWIHLKSGIERSIYQFVLKTQHQVTIFTNHYDAKNTFPEFKQLDVRELNRVSVKRDLLSVLSAGITIVQQKIDLRNYQLLLVHSDGLGDLITLRNKDVPTICYCHTPLRPIFDSFYRQLAYQKTFVLLKPFFLFFSSIFKTIDKKLWKNYRHIFFNSQETLKRALQGGLVSNYENNFSILHPGTDLKKLKPSWVYQPYFFIPGRIMWTKNIELGINAFIQFKKKFPQFDKFSLIIAGHLDKKSQNYFKKLRHLIGTRVDIKCILDPSDQKLKKLYESCWVTLACSFNEDWGLTVLEANAYGKPVIGVNQGGLKETIIEGRTGYLTEPNSKSFVKAMFKLASNLELNKRLGRSAYKNVKKYNMDMSIKELDQFIFDL